MIKETKNFLLFVQIVIKLTTEKLKVMPVAVFNGSHIHYAMFRDIVKYK